jgi:hypothetical protein
MKKLITVCFLYSISYSCLFSQTALSKKQLSAAEDRLKAYALQIMNEEDIIPKLRADSFFTRGLVQALKTPYSFHYRFDSLTTISKVYAPDSSFRILTWQIMKDFTSYRYKGAIQFNTKDGSLKLVPLFDMSEFTDNPTDSIRTNENWIGALYYNIIQKEYNGKKYYTLLGYDENDARTTRKWIEVLTFTADNKPIFGGKFFNYPSDVTKPKQPAYRYCYEYKKQANAKLNFDPTLDQIVFAKLVSETGEPSQKQTLVPYGTYEGFKWELGKWTYTRPAEL